MLKCIKFLCCNACIQFSPSYRHIKNADKPTTSRYKARIFVLTYMCFPHFIYAEWEETLHSLNVVKSREQNRMKTTLDAHRKEFYCRVVVCSSSLKWGWSMNLYWTARLRRAHIYLINLWWWTRILDQFSYHDSSSFSITDFDNNDL